VACKYEVYIWVRMERHLHLIDMIYLVLVVSVQEENYITSAVFQAKYERCQLSPILLSEYAQSRVF